MLLYSSLDCVLDEGNKCKAVCCFRFIVKALDRVYFTQVVRTFGVRYPACKSNCA